MLKISKVSKQVLQVLSIAFCGWIPLQQQLFSMDVNHEYSHFFQNTNNNIKTILCRKQGNGKNQKYPTLGYSAYGMFTDTLFNVSGLVKIKYPHVLKNCDPCNFSDHLTPAQNKNFCCVVKNDGKLKPKRNHKYYYQV